VLSSRYDRPRYPFESDGIVHIHDDLKGYDSYLRHKILGSVVELTFTDIDTEIAKIKISYVNMSFIQGCGPINCCLTFVNKSNRKDHYLLKDSAAKEILEELNQIANYLPANCIEHRAHKDKRQTTSVLDKEFWSVTGPWSKVEDNEKEYNETIDPITINEFIRTIKDLRKKHYSVIDVGGGKGRLANKLIAAAEELGIKLDYILIEPDASQSKVAEANNLNVINATLSEFKNSDLYQQLMGKIDIIISSGGPLNIQVVSHLIAVDSLKAIKDLLNDDGRIIATGRTQLAMSRKEMEKYGFTFFVTSHRIPFVPQEQEVSYLTNDTLRKSETLYVMGKNRLG